MSQRLDPAVQFEEGSMEFDPDVEQRDQRMRQSGIGLDRFAGSLIKGTVADALAQPDAEHLQQTANLVLQVDALAQQRLTAG